MNRNGLIPLIFILILCTASGSFMKSKHLRVKRWEGTGDMSNMFRGTAGVDYPDLKTIPNTNFRCEGQEYEGGLYADVETRCQVYHVCHDGRKDSFMCGRGTIFNQQILACDYWYSTECENAPSFYYVNSQIGNSDTSWVPPPKDNSNNYQTNYQGTGEYNPNNPGTHNNQGTGGYNSNNPGAYNNQGTGGYNSNNPDAYNNQGTGGYNPNNPGTHNNQGTGGYNSNNPGGYNPNNPDTHNNQGTGGYNSNNPGANNNQGTGEYNSNNPGTNNQDYGRAGYITGDTSGSSQGSNDQKPCCCLKNTYKAPWNFPLIIQNKKK